MSHYLVTGGAGFIGSNLVKQLLDDGHRVRVLDNYVGGKKRNRLHEGAEYLDGDIRNTNDVEKALQDIDGIFHMAALPRVSYSVEYPEETHDVNVNGTLRVLLQAKKIGVKRLVFSSSSSTYGNQEIFPLNEDTMIKKPIAPYALHKYIGEEYCRLFSSLYGVETVSLVYFNVYGPAMDPEGAYALVVGKFLKQRADGEPMTICGDGEYYRDYTHVADVVRANILAMAGQKVGKGEVINIGNNDPRSVNDIARIIGGETVTVPDRPGDGRFFQADNTKAKTLLDWQPTIKLEEGIEEMKKEMGIATYVRHPTNQRQN